MALLFCCCLLSKQARWGCSAESWHGRAKTFTSTHVHCIFHGWFYPFLSQNVIPHCNHGVFTHNNQQLLSMFQNTVICVNGTFVSWWDTLWCLILVRCSCRTWLNVVDTGTGSVVAGKMNVVQMIVWRFYLKLAGVDWALQLTCVTLWTLSLSPPLWPPSEAERGVAVVSIFPAYLLRYSFWEGKGEGFTEVIGKGIAVKRSRMVLDMMNISLSPSSADTSCRLVRYASNMSHLCCVLLIYSSETWGCL